MQPSSAPPPVEMWPKPSSLSQAEHSSLTTTQAIGYMPPVMPLPTTMMSGSTPAFWMHHISPVRIRPGLHLVGDVERVVASRTAA